METINGSMNESSEHQSTNMDIVSDNQELDTSRDSDGDGTYDSSNEDRNREGKSLPAKLTIPTENNPSSANISLLQPSLPSLRGRMLVENGALLCRGVWAMSDAAHDIPGQTSDFEYKLQKPLNPGTSIESLAVDGKYSGWFMLKQAPPKPPLRIDEKDVHLHFVSDNEGGWNISGDGVNKFGRFSIHGTISSAGRLQLYKAYQVKKQKGKPPGTPGRVPRTPTAHVAPSPRESSIRVRKPSVHIEDEPLLHQLAPPKLPKVVTPRPAVTPRAEIQRAQRASQVVIKCQDLLKELSKHLQASYFLEPVDYVRLNIPDYPTVIDEPMDFSTIRTNLENSQYDSHEAFAEHMRLVFRNAITYNTRRDNPVHIAAREMSNRFEERYRMMVASLASHPTADYEALRSTGGHHKSSKKAPKARTSVGPRQSIDVLPPATDTSMQAIVDLHKKMMDMENEIKRLKATVRQNEIRTSLDAQRAAAQEPLTIDEKRALCAQISRLEGDRLAHVVDIIQSALPPNSRSNSNESEDAELEIPVDELDTFTLRKLQDYVMGASASSVTMLQPKKKRGPPPGASPRAPKEPAAKKAKTSGQVGRPSKQKVQQQAETTSYTNISASASAAPTFFSDRTFDSAAAEGSGSDNDDEPHERRGRSDSLDLFVSEMDAEFPAEDGTDAQSHLHNLDAWREVTAAPKVENTSSGSWGEAVFEKMERENRDRIEEERQREQRARAEMIRQQANTAPAPTSSFSVPTAGNDDAEVQRLREAERQRLESMQQTVHLDASRESLEQTFYT